MLSPAYWQTASSDGRFVPLREGRRIVERITDWFAHRGLIDRCAGWANLPVVDTERGRWYSTRSAARRGLTWGVGGGPAVELGRVAAAAKNISLLERHGWTSHPWHPGWAQNANANRKSAPERDDQNVMIRSMPPVSWSLRLPSSKGRAPPAAAFAAPSYQS